MHSEKIIDEYIEMIKENPENYYEDFLVLKEMIKNSDAYYGGMPVPFNYQPLFMDSTDLENFKYIVDMMMKIGKKVTRKYIECPLYRKLFNFPKFIEEMILVDNGYDVEIPIARFDVFYNSKEDFKFCEINTDGSSAMNEEMVVGKTLMSSKALQEFSKKYQLSTFELFDSWVDESLKLFEKYDPENKNPNVAIMDFMEHGTPSDFEKFKKAYEKRGLNCEIVEARDLKYQNGKLYYNDYRIDMIYRRMVTFELVENKECYEDFIKAYMDRAMCTIGSIQSQVIHNKIFFKVLFDKETREFLSEEECEFIDKHVPFTGLFNGDKKIFEEVLNHKDDYIIKPADKNASQGVYTGRDLTKEEWAENLKRDFGKDTIYQEFVDPKKINLVEFSDDKKAYKKAYANVIGIFVYNEKLSGFYSRMGNENIISGLIDYRDAPAVLAIRRDMNDLLPRINELSKISKERALTEEELEERKILREEYLKRFRAGFEKELLNIKVLDDEGKDVTEEKLEYLYQKKKRKNG